MIYRTADRLVFGAAAIGFVGMPLAAVAAGYGWSSLSFAMAGLFVGGLGSRLMLDPLTETRR